VKGSVTGKNMATANVIPASRRGGVRLRVGLQSVLSAGRERPAEIQCGVNLHECFRLHNGDYPNRILLTYRSKMAHPQLGLR
jgi:hypothetical protein